MGRTRRRKPYRPSNSVPAPTPNIKKQNIRKAVEETVEEVGSDPDYKSILKFYPEGSGNYVVPNLKAA